MKDEFFYSDLIYYIEGYANLGSTNDEERNIRINKRLQPILTSENGNPIYSLSDFQLEFYEFVLSVSKTTNTFIKSFSEMANYPDVVKSLLQELKSKEATLI